MLRKLMHPAARTAAIVCLLATPATTAYANLVVYLNNGQIATEQDVVMWQDQETGGWHIILEKLYNPSGVSLYEIRGSGGETIDSIDIKVPCWKGPNGECVLAGSPVFVRVLSDPPDGVKTVHKIEQTGDGEIHLTHVIVTHDIGEIDVRTIGILEAGRDVIGPINAFTTDNFMRGISEVHAGRHILGDLTAHFGKVGIVHAGENIGTPSNTVGIKFKYNALDMMAKDVHVDIDTRLGASAGGDGAIWRMDVNRFYGTVSAPHITYHSKTGEPASVRVHEKFGGSMILGKSFDDLSHTVELPIGGMSGQVIINADNAGGTWQAPIYLGPPSDPDHTVLNGPGYALTSDELGGGAVGVVPFRLHHASSSPPSGSLVILGGGDDGLIVELEHYGPIHVTGEEPISIARRPVSGSHFMSVPMANFTVQVSESDSKVLLVGSSPGGDGFEAGYEYRISPAPALNSDVDGLPPVAWTSDYYVTVELKPGEPCVGDLNGDGKVDVLDLFALVYSWGACAPGGACTADLTGDGEVGVPDLIKLLNNWGRCEGR